MKLFYTLLIFLLSPAVLMAQATAAFVPNSMVAQGGVRIPAYFPGGTQAMINYINRQLQYPPKAKAQKRGGTVYVDFIVQTDGSFRDIHLSSPQSDLKQEVLRVLQSMPKWIPANTGGEKVESSFIMAIKFTPDL